MSRPSRLPWGAVLIAGLTCSCAFGTPGWVEQLEKQLRCGMSTQEVQALTPLKLLALEGEQPWLGRYYFRRGSTDLWLQFEKDQLASFIVSSASSLKTVRLTPRKNLCTGEVSFLVRLLLPDKLVGAKVLLDGSPVAGARGQIVNIGVPLGTHEIRIEGNGYASIAKQVQNAPGDRGDKEISLLKADLPTRAPG